MTELPLNIDRPLLNMSDIQKWKEEKSRLEAEMKELQEQLSAINKKLEAAYLFLPSDVREKQATIPKTSGEEDEIESLPTLILKLLRESARPLTTKELRKQIEQTEFWPKRLEANGTYFYTAMGRLQRREAIAKEGNRYRLSHDEKTPNAETSGDLASGVVHSEIGPSQPDKPPVAP